MSGFVPRLVEALSTDSARFVLLVVALHIVDLFWLIPPPRRVLSRGWLARFRLLGSGLVVRSLAPWSLNFVIEPLPLALGGDGQILVRQPHRITSTRPVGWGVRYRPSVPGSEIRRVDDALKLSGMLFSPGSVHAARFWEQQLAALSAGQKRSKRNVARYLERAFDVGEARDRLARYARLSLPVRLFGLALLVHIFFVFSLIAFDPEWLIEWRLLLFVFLGLLSLTVSSFWVAHLRLFPDDRSGRFGRAVGFVLNFPSAPRASDWLGRTLFVGIDELAVLAAVGDVKALRREAESRLRKLLNPAPVDRIGVPEEANELADEFDRLVLARIKSLLREFEIDPDALTAAPAFDPTTETYCPRCSAVYASEIRKCADCEIATFGP
ncbi:MAG: hypothetical protein AAFP04_08595 [Myxococcota bacterium]